MNATTRQRRPAFDRDEGVETAKRLFRARGYDAASVADLTQALGINPPSLYAAYGSKLGLFERVLQSYCATDTLPIDDILSAGKLPAAALTDLLVAAARHYTRDREQLGCMVTEAMQADDEKARAMAIKYAKSGTDVIRAYVAAHSPRKEADRITDYVQLNLRGLSSYARLGNTQKKLVDCARTAGKALEGEFSDTQPAN